MTVNRPSLCQIANGLIDHRLKDGQGNVRLFYAIIHQGLNIRLGKHTAARSNGVNLPALGGQFVKSAGIRREQRGHMVDKRAGTAGTNAVHALFRSLTEVGYLGILAAELHHGIRLGNEIFYGCCAGNNLLHKGQTNTLRNTHACRTGKREGKLLLSHQRFQLRQILLQGIANF